jgi:hypothetical protein
MNDVMWAKPDGARVLIAPNERVAEFVGAIYHFDEVVIDAVHVGRTPRALAVAAAGLRMRLNLGRAFVLPLPHNRPLAFTRFVESPIAERLMNVKTYGVTNKGIEEWYQARSVSWVQSASASLDGTHLGAMSKVVPLKVGVSEPPSRPSVVCIKPTLRDATGHLQDIIERRATQ